MKSVITYSFLALIILIAGVLVYLLTFDINQYKPVLVKTVREMTGRELRMDGDLSLRPSLTPVITVEGISLANAPWSTSGEQLLTAGRIEAKLALLPLLAGKIEIERLGLRDTHLALETSDDGTGNWIMTSTGIPGPSAASTNSRSTLVTVGQFAIQNFRISYHDGITGRTRQIAINEFTTVVSNLDSPVAFDLSGDYGTIPVRLNGTLGPISTLLANSSYAVDISGQVSAFNVSATGRIDKPLSAEGMDIRISADTASLANINSLAGTDIPEVGPLSLSAGLKFADLHEITIDDMTMQLGQSKLSGHILYHSGDIRPAVSIHLLSEQLDLTPFSGETEGRQKPDYLFPREPLPLAALSQVNLKLSLAATRLALKQYELGDFSLETILDDGNLQATVSTGLANGSLSARLGLDSDPHRPFSVNVALDASDIQLEQLPHDQQKPWFSGGPVTIRIRGTGQGNSVAEIMAGYNGHLIIEVGAATLPNSDVNLFGADILMSVFNSLNPLSKSEKSSALECAVINLDIRDGIAKIDRQIALQTTRMSMVGSGEINFKNEELSLGIKPYAREGVGINLGNIAGIARIGGTLANQKMEVDAQGVLMAGATVGAAFATGGLSMLAQGLFSRTTDDPDPCRTALGQSLAAGTPPVPAAAQPEEESKGLLDDVKGGFNRLFGR